MAPLPCHYAPPSQCEERSNPSAITQRHGLPRRCAPRNDGGWSLRPAQSSRRRPVMPRNEAIHWHCTRTALACASVHRHERITARASRPEASICGRPGNGGTAWGSGSNWVFLFWSCSLASGRYTMPNGPMPRPWPNAGPARPRNLLSLHLNDATEAGPQRRAAQTAQNKG